MSKRPLVNVAEGEQGAAKQARLTDENAPRNSILISPSGFDPAGFLLMLWVGLFNYLFLLPGGMGGLHGAVSHDIEESCSPLVFLGRCHPR